MNFKYFVGRRRRLYFYIKYGQPFTWVRSKTIPHSRKNRTGLSFSFKREGVFIKAIEKGAVLPHCCSARGRNKRAKGTKRVKFTKGVTKADCSLRKCNKECSLRREIVLRKQCDSIVERSH